MSSFGKIHFSTKYVNGKLDVKIIECQGLKDVDFIGKSDPYVCLYILPGKHDTLKTKVVNNSSNPVFNTTFSFTLQQSMIRNKWAVFQVFDSDIGKDEKLGEGRFPFIDMNMDLTAETHHWLDLAKFTEVPPHVVSRGKMSTSVATSLVSRESNTSRRTSHMSSAAPAVSTRTEYHSGSSYNSGYSFNNSNTNYTHNLRELNNRLDNIVSQNRKYEDVDTKLIINLLSNKIQNNVNGEIVISKMDQFLQPIRDEHLILARLNAEIDILRKENEMLEVRNDEIQERISERSTTEMELKNKKRRLEEDHASKMRERETLEASRRKWEIEVEKVRAQMGPVLEELKMLKMDLGKWDGELELVAAKAQLWGAKKDSFASYFSASIDREIECPSIYWDLLKEYSNRMDDEVKKLKEMNLRYNSEIRGLEGKEVERLNTILTETDRGGYVDTTGILSDLEIIKKRMLSLEMDRLELRQKIFELRFDIDQEEALFYAQFEAKEGALMFLKAEYETMKSKFYHQLTRAEESEISRFSRIIGEEEQIIDRKSSKFTSNDPRRVVMGLSLSPQVDQVDGQVVGWNIEQHAQDIY